MAAAKCSCGRCVTGLKNVVSMRQRRSLSYKTRQQKELCRQRSKENLWLRFRIHDGGAELPSLLPSPTRWFSSSFPAGLDLLPRKGSEKACRYWPNALAMASTYGGRRGRSSWPTPAWSRNSGVCVSAKRASVRRGRFSHGVLSVSIESARPGGWGRFRPGYAGRSDLELFRAEREFSFGGDCLVHFQDGDCGF